MSFARGGAQGRPRGRPRRPERPGQLRRALARRQYAGEARDRATGLRLRRARRRSIGEIEPRTMVVVVDRGGGQNGAGGDKGGRRLPVVHGAVLAARKWANGQRARPALGGAVVQMDMGTRPKGRRKHTGGELRHDAFGRVGGGVYGARASPGREGGEGGAHLEPVGVPERARGRLAGANRRRRASVTKVEDELEGGRCGGVRLGSSA
jgi:hypothetical protein